MQLMVVANPIYDTVFKYLMEDERIARTILSALLQKEVVKVVARRHEMTNEVRDTISVFRIDFGATVLEDDGQERLILIELQKTWLETETLRFRQYLGAHYSSPDNMAGKGHESHALPMVAVYLLGHKVGDIEEPVLYVRHRPYNYNGQLVTKGMPNAFVDSLTHNSIIIQIPRLHGQINNRLDKVLSIFDQTRKDQTDRRVLNIDADEYDGDAEMQRIVNRLVAAAADAKMRKNMNLEDEIFQAVENRDTLIMIKDKVIAEKNSQLAEKDSQLAEKDSQLAEKDSQLAEKDGQIEALLRSSVLAMSDAGLHQEEIARRLGISVEKVKSLSSK